MAFDTYMIFAKGASGTEVNGETKDTAMSAKKALEIYSFSWGASNPTTIGSGTGGSGAGRVSISSFNIMKKTDTASLGLFKACCIGDHFPSVQVIMRKAGAGTTQDAGQFLIYEFKEVFVDSIQWSGSSGGDDTPTESVSLAFGSAKITYKPQNADGTLGDNIEAMWSVVKNAETQDVA